MAKDAASVVPADAGLGGAATETKTARPPAHTHRHLEQVGRLGAAVPDQIAKTSEVPLLLGPGRVVTGNFVANPRLVLLLFANDFGLAGHPELAWTCSASGYTAPAAGTGNSPESKRGAPSPLSLDGSVCLLGVPSQLRPAPRGPRRPADQPRNRGRLGLGLRTRSS